MILYYRLRRICARVRNITFLLIFISMLTETTFATGSDVSNLYSTQNSQVHIKGDIEDALTYTEIYSILATAYASGYSVKNIFANRVTLTNQLPTTDDAGASQASNANTTNKSGNDGLTYSDWLEVDDDEWKSYLGFSGNVWDELTHSYASMCYEMITQGTGYLQDLYNYSDYASTDEYGFRKYTANGYEYYMVAVAAYFGIDGVCSDYATLTSNSEYYSAYQNMAGHAVQIELEDGNIINCVIGDVKSASDDTMDGMLRGHWSKAAKYPSTKTISIVEVIVDCIHGDGNGNYFCHSGHEVYKNNRIGESWTATSEYHNGSPWTSNPVRIRLGPVLPN